MKRLWATYQVEIEVKAFDRPHLTTDIMTTITDTSTIINAVNAEGDEEQNGQDKS